MSTGRLPHTRLIWSSSCASSAVGWEDYGAARGSRQQQGSSASSRPGGHGRGVSMHVGYDMWALDVIDKKKSYVFLLKHICVV